MNREVQVQFWEGAGLRCPALLAYLSDYPSFDEVVAQLPCVAKKVVRLINEMLRPSC